MTELDLRGSVFRWPPRPLVRAMFAMVAIMIAFPEVALRLPGMVF